MDLPVDLSAQEVLMGAGALSQGVLPARPDRRRAALVTQPGASSPAETVAELLRDEGVEVHVHLVPEGEKAKSLSTAEELYEWLAGIRLGRSDTIVGVGGGSVTDLAGFVAASWLRGVELCLVPTTLLGAVDAAIGGKTGINLGGKNLVGAFWPATRVIIDLDLLSGLPEDLLREGMAEALKAGLVGDPALVRLLADQGRRAPLEEVIGRAVAVKQRLVRRDPYDRGVRRFLNYGHTIGHALEMMAGLSHGEAISVGMMAAATASEELLGFGEAGTQRAALDRLGLPLEAPAAPLGNVLDLLELDKKRGPGELRMVLLRAIGRPEVREVEAATVERALASIGVR